MEFVQSSNDFYIQFIGTIFLILEKHIKVLYLFFSKKKNLHNVRSN